MSTAKPHFETIEELILHNMSRAEKRRSKDSIDICLEVVFFLAKNLGMRYRAADLRDVAENVHRILQSIEIPPALGKPRTP